MTNLNIEAEREAAYSEWCQRIQDTTRRFPSSHEAWVAACKWAESRATAPAPEAATAALCKLVELQDETMATAWGTDQVREDVLRHRWANVWKDARAALAAQPKAEAGALTPVTDKELISRIQQVRKSVGTIAEADAALAARTKAAPVAEALEPVDDEKPSGQVYGIIDPDYGRIYTIIRKLAWEEGYAIGLQGSFTRDLDLIAVPWGSVGHGPEHLVRRIVASSAGLREAHGNPGEKPHGRKVWTLLLEEFGDPRFVDLSIMPHVAPDDTGAVDFRPWPQDANAAFAQAIERSNINTEDDAAEAGHWFNLGWVAKERTAPASPVVAGAEQKDPTHPNHPGHHDGMTCERASQVIVDLIESQYPGKRFKFKDVVAGIAPEGFVLVRKPVFRKDAPDDGGEYKCCGAYTPCRGECAVFVPADK